jgi:hypothetical protein
LPYSRQSLTPAADHDDNPSLVSSGMLAPQPYESLAEVTRAPLSAHDRHAGFSARHAK